MDLSMMIATMSMNMSQASAVQSAGTAVAKKAMDTQQVQADGLQQLIQSAPSFGHQLDVRV